MGYEDLPDWFIAVFERFEDLDEDKLKLWINSIPEETRKRIVRAVRLIYLSKYLSKLTRISTESEDYNHVDLTSLRLSSLVIAVESLATPPDYHDFYQWFISNKFSHSDEINISKNDFKSVYDDYKLKYGSYRSFKRFVDNYLKDENIKDEYLTVESLLSKYSGETSSQELELIIKRMKRSIQANEEVIRLTFDGTMREIYNLRSDYFHKGKAIITSKYDVFKIEKYCTTGLQTIRYRSSLTSWFETIVIDSLYNFWKESVDNIL
ncbi:MAG: hypothetical protein ACFFAJ_09295 [Candidatus Hodarchaeota archaeon]